MPILDTSVKYIHEGMRGAPVLNGTVGAIIALLDTFLINGWGLATATSASVLDGVCTVNMSALDVFEDGCVIVMAGATPGALNAEHRLTQGGNVLKFNTTAPNGPVTGTITVKYAPLGWEKAFSGPNGAVYRSLDITTPQRYLRVDDSVPTFARVRGYNAMTGVDAGTGPFPTDAQVDGGLYWFKSTSANTTPRRYTLRGDTGVFYYGVTANFDVNFPPEDSSAYELIHEFGYAGALSPTGDVWATRISGAANNSWSQTAGALGLGNVGHVYSERAISGVGDPITSHRRKSSGNPAAASGADTNGFGPYPGAVDARLRICSYFLTQEELIFTPRAVVAGVYGVPHDNLTGHPTLKARDTIPGSGVLSGRKLALAWVGGGGRQGGIFFDVTGPWR
ncbi:hypothetical protein FVQ98_14025 [Ottowia sp. GY511]|uniref:Minor tail protein n=1 Tax=Ottowia flava TaxID=2675430 RepID=A0ABW4KU81_9BURK|nr:hypothetical protein [Ottowia sp. GY511]TXK26491.1 hypothetical protein FVQ98_14025 [Ottowia sp. GY511]